MRIPRPSLRRSLLLAFLAPAGLAAVAATAAELKRDVVYGEAAGQTLRLDARIPDGPGPFPVALLVHGGGWSGGDKAGSDKPGSGADITAWFAPLEAAGFVSFSINYRLAPQHRWPACLEDVQTAIRWAKAHASEYRGDPRRIALFGHSAGGHLVCLAATVGGADTAVQAVVGYAPVTDLVADTEVRGGLSQSLQKLHAVPHEPSPATLALLRETSPINHVHSGLPPFLLVHGDADKTVPYQQSVVFRAKLREAGVTCDLITIPQGPHGLATWSQLAPGYTAELVAWLRRNLSVKP
jgi:alpha-L-fucosidase 2